MTSSNGGDRFTSDGERAVDAATVQRLTEREERRFATANATSRTRYDAARDVLAGGVVSSFQLQHPWPVYLERARASTVWDVDGNARRDFHNGFGAMLQGHAHPAITDAIARAAATGTHVGATGEDAVAVATALRHRWKMDSWRFATTGSEATMDALRIARAATGRDVVVKMFGAYHGHHDTVLVSVGDDDGGADRFSLPSLPAGEGIPGDVAALTAAVPFNDAEALDARLGALAAEGRPAACVIVEPVFQMGVLVPEPGYLAAVREVTRRHGALLVFDEVKSGFAVGPAGFTGECDVEPDVVTLGKALGGGLPVAAVGASRETMELVATRRVYQVGTFNGNALAMAVARENLERVLTPEAHKRLGELGALMVDGCRDVLDRAGRAGHGAFVGARGFVSLTPSPARDHTGVGRAHPTELSRLAWLYLMNRGLFVTPARPLQWMAGLGHTDDDVAAYVAVLEELVSELR
jgi:glutamate-1-semialdehyde 2,1-aminomutase